MKKNEQKIPKIGDTLYLVAEHLYYVDGKAGPLKEYCVYSGTVKDIITLSYKDIRIKGLDADGKVHLWYRKVSDIGTQVFLTAQEAALLAKEMSDDYDRRFSWISDTPVRRTWEHLLKEATE